MIFKQGDILKIDYSVDINLQDNPVARYLTGKIGIAVSCFSDYTYIKIPESEKQDFEKQCNIHLNPNNTVAITNKYLIRVLDANKNSDKLHNIISI